MHMHLFDYTKCTRIFALGCYVATAAAATTTATTAADDVDDDDDINDDDVVADFAELSV